MTIPSLVLSSTPSGSLAIAVEATESVSLATVIRATGTISIAGNGSGDGEPEQPSNKEKVNDNYLKNKGFDGHKVKEETRGTTKDGSKYDIYVDKDTDQLWVFRKGGKGEGIPTGEYIK